MKTIVYVDGFNLYYGCLKNTSYRWLNLSAMCNLMLPKNNIIKIKYYTARVTSRSSKPGQAQRQEIYIRALRTLPNVDIIFGHFSAHSVSMYLADSPVDKPRYIDVINTEEKGSDVNLATDLMNDSCKGRIEAAVLITNDSDLKRPVAKIRQQYKLPVVILNPNKKRPSKALGREASITKPIRPWQLAQSQFPDLIQKGTIKIRKPQKW